MVVFGVIKHIKVSLFLSDWSVIVHSNLVQGEVCPRNHFNVHMKLFLLQILPNFVLH